jgi:hypothetical protein
MYDGTSLWIAKRMFEVSAEDGEHRDADPHNELPCPDPARGDDA